jgi:hypothetical protein
MRFWNRRKEVDKGKRKRKVRSLGDEYNNLLLTHERQRNRLIQEAWRLEKRRSREPSRYVR